MGYYNFPVVRRKVVVDGVDMKHDALYRGDTNEPLSVVGRGYKLVTHQEANAFVERVLDVGGYSHEVGKTWLKGHGRQFLKEFRLPELRFTAKEGSDSTALDGGRSDDYVPTVILRNSYDRTSPLEFLFGTFRLVCANGMIVPAENIKELKIAHRWVPDYDALAKELHAAFEVVVSRIRQLHTRLNAEPAHVYWNLSFLSALGKRLVEEMVARSRSTLRPLDASAFTMLDPNRFSVSDNLSAYALFQLATEVLSHSVGRYHRAIEKQARIAHIFGV